MNVSAGIGVIGFASPMLQEVFGGSLIGVTQKFGDLDETQFAAIATVAAGITALLSLLNIGGRFFWASLSDKVGRKMTCIVFFVLGGLLPATAWPEKTGTVSNTDRMVQMGKQAVTPPGQAKPDLWIIQQLAGRLGLTWNYTGEHDGVAAVYEEMRQAMHASISGITRERLERESSVIYPCLSADDAGETTMCIDKFPTADGRVRLVPADIIPANERPDAEFPFVLITGRQLEHWHTGSMTRRAAVLDAIEPIAMASMCGADLRNLGVAAGDAITVQSRRGEVAIHVRRDDGTPEGAVFMPFAHYEAVANVLTNSALDPFGTIPEFKYCAVAVRAGGVPAQSVGYALDTDAVCFTV